MPDQLEVKNDSNEYSSLLEMLSDSFALCAGQIQGQGQDHGRNHFPVHHRQGTSDLPDALRDSTEETETRNEKGKEIPTGRLIERGSGTASEKTD